MELDALAAALAAAYEKMIHPSRVLRAVPGPVMVIGRTEEKVFVHSYRETDPQEVDAGVFHALRHCHGQPIDEWRAVACRKDGVDLDDATIRRLADLGILLQLT